MADDLRKDGKNDAFEKKEAVKSSVALDASQIIDKIDGETEILGAERVAENLENIRLIWTQHRSKAPTVSEFEELAKILSDGFTKRQLLHYFLSSHRQDSQSELLGAFGTDLYKRSQWSPGSTLFPGDALKRLIDLKAEIQAQKGSNKVLKPFLKYRMITRNKHVIVDRILRQRWHLRTQEDMMVSGELDIWLSRDHLKVLLNHRKNLKYSRFPVLTKCRKRSFADFSPATRCQDRCLKVSCGRACNCRFRHLWGSLQIYTVPSGEYSHE